MIIKKTVLKDGQHFLKKIYLKIYWERERSLHERANMISSAEKRVKLEVAKNLLDVLDDETIAVKIGLDIEEIKRIRNEIY